VGQNKTSKKILGCGYTSKEMDILECFGLWPKTMHFFDGLDPFLGGFEH
jgi:hypothetical protein